MHPDPALVTAVVVAIAAAWATAVVYSRRHYPFIGCRTCRGRGRFMEPHVLMWACLRWRRRAWRPCASCGGAGGEERR